MSSEDSDYSPSLSIRRSRTASRRTSQPYPAPRSNVEAKVTRERGGCLTCRVRRKKCTDLVVNNEAPKKPCKGCARLHLECLGWAVKRPRWLKNKTTLEAIKKRIKDHLSGPVKSASTKPTLSLAPFYKKPRDWIAPFPVSDQSPILSDNDTLNNDSPQSPASSSTLDDDRHDTKLTPTPYEQPSFDHGCYHEPTLVYSNDLTPVPTLPLTHDLSTLSMPVSRDIVNPYNGSPISETSTLAFESGGSSLGSMSPRELSHEFAAAEYLQDIAEQPPAAEDNQQFLVLSNAPQDLYRPNLYIYSLPLPMDTLEFRVFTEWHRTCRPLIARFLPPDDLEPFEISEFVLGTGIQHTEAIETTYNLIRLRHLSSADHLARDEKHALASQQDAVFLSLWQRSDIHPGENGNVVAALFGLNFCLFLGGGSGWQGCLQVARRWVYANWPAIENGTAAPIAKLFAGMTAWYDILGAVTLRQPPILGMPLLAKMLAKDSPIQLESIMGCENLVMFGIAFITVIGYEKRSRGFADDSDELRPYAPIIQESFLVQAPYRWDGIPPDPFALPSIAFPATANNPMLLWASDTLPVSAVTSAFRAAAHVYLETTISGCNPRAANVACATDEAIVVLKQIPPSDADRSLIWPLCVVGCMASRPMDQEYIARRFELLDGRDKLGNGARAEELMKHIWAQRESGGVVDWIDVMGHFPVLLA